GLSPARNATHPCRVSNSMAASRPPRQERSGHFLAISTQPTPKEGVFMVYLSRIYTRAGDGGETGLGDGTRVPKDHSRIAAYGTVDELNAVLGLLLAQSPQPAEADLLQSIQNDLFDVGADLCLPGSDRLRVRPEQSTRLEEAIDRLNAGLTPLTSFILPGGAPAAAWCHLARTVCRRAEREVV